MALFCLLIRKITLFFDKTENKYCIFKIYWYNKKRNCKTKEDFMIKKVAILANGGDVSGFNAVIRAIIKTA